MWQVLGTFFLVSFNGAHEGSTQREEEAFSPFLPSCTHLQLNLLCTPHPSHLRIIGPQISPFAQQKPVSATQAMIYYEKVLYLEGPVS